jgi:hypothetical protein
MEDAALAFEHYSCAACTDHYRNTHFALPGWLREPTKRNLRENCAVSFNRRPARSLPLPVSSLAPTLAGGRFNLVWFDSIGFKTRRLGRLERFGNDSALELGKVDPTKTLPLRCVGSADAGDDQTEQ